jgi:hypothetical protein
MKLSYKLINKNRFFEFKSLNNNLIQIENEMILRAINYSHSILDKFTEFEVNVFEILGMRNLSAFIGEIFAASLIKCSNGLFIKNPHQDGYPDLLLFDKTGKILYDKLKDRLREKQPFSPFQNGGIEIKATCGSVPTPAQCLKKGTAKPDIGDQRINVIKGYDWKAHHRETNNLMGIVWDFINGVPRIISVFFSNDLTIEEWGKIVQPKDGGGRTTSVSIMTRDGVKRMYDGCLYVIDDKRYIDFLNRYNKGTLL